MSKKLLVPVLPSDRFYDAVVASGDLVAQEGGLVAFLFTQVRPPDSVYEDSADGRPSDLDLEQESGESEALDLDTWRGLQVAALEEARQILADRGVGDDQIDYLFADAADHLTSAPAIADEAAAGAYDLVVLARGYFEEEVDDAGSDPAQIAEAIQQSIGDEVGILVT